MQMRRWYRQDKVGDEALVVQEEGEEVGSSVRRLFERVRVGRPLEEGEALAVQDEGDLKGDELRRDDTV